MTPKQCEEKLYTLPDKEMYLSAYKSWYENKRVEEAIASLAYRTKLIIDDKFLLNPQLIGSTIFLVTDKHFLDFLLIVGATRGFQAMTPDSTQKRDWLWEFTLANTDKEFKCNDFNLGFNTSQSMMFVGQQGESETWLVVNPHEYFLHGTSDPSSGGTTVLPEGPRTVLTYLLTQALGECDSNRVSFVPPIGRISKDDIDWSTIVSGFKYVSSSPHIFEWTRFRARSRFLTIYRSYCSITFERVRSRVHSSPSLVSYLFPLVQNMENSLFTMKMFLL
jgi:hypothetical protein